MLVFTRFAAALSLLAFSAWPQEAHKGVHPRATPDDYAVRASGSNVIYAASLIPADQAKHLFAFDITGKYMVFEVACFPKEGQALATDPDDFLAKRGDKGDLTHTSAASDVALAIQMENAPKLSARNTDIRTQVNVGYETGTDPMTGRRAGGVYGGGGASVEHGGIDPRPPDDPRPGGTAEDRKLLQSQLAERQLPAGRFDHAVAGYLYFLRSAVKKDGNGNYVLQHLGETNSAGVSETVELPVPGKNR